MTKQTVKNLSRPETNQLLPERDLGFETQLVVGAGPTTLGLLKAFRNATRKIILLTLPSYHLTRLVARLAIKCPYPGDRCCCTAVVGHAPLSFAWWNSPVAPSLGEWTITCRHRHFVEPEFIHVPAIPNIGPLMWQSETPDHIHVHMCNQPKSSSLP